MLDDLNRFFDYPAKIQKRIVPAWVIMETDPRRAMVMLSKHDSTPMYNWGGGGYATDH